MQFAVADIKICATSTTSDYTSLDWNLKDADDRAFGSFNKQVGAKNPNLTDVSSVATGDCSRGWFDVRGGSRRYERG
jgi:hypothetical protein